LHAVVTIPIFADMRMLLLLLVLLSAGQAAFTRADPLADAAALAAQKDAEERYKRLSADVQNLLETQEMLLKRQETVQQRLNSLADDLRALKEDQGRSSRNFATREDLRNYVDKLKEVDEKREADKKLILESIKDLGKLPAPAPEPKSKGSRTAESAEEMPYVYVVKKNDRLLDIVAAYNDYFQKNGRAKITKDQVLKANPNLKPDRLLQGQKIHIPVPPKESK
jgi:predicted nuclease with TOPRIM domain